LAVVHDYDNYQRVYRPVVTSSRTLACADTRILGLPVLAGYFESGGLGVRLNQ
jgi:hypothetical protein